MAKELKLAMMPWWPADFSASTRHMARLERLAFRELLDYQWINGGLPADVKRLALTLGISETEFREVWPALREHFVTDPNNPKAIINKRLERERLTSIELRTKASAKAKQAADARWNNASGNAPSIMPEALLEQSPLAQAPALASADSQPPSEACMQSEAHTHDARVEKDRTEALTYLARKGITEATVIAALGVGGVEDIGLDEIDAIRVMVTKVKNEGVSVETAFAPKYAPPGKPQTATPKAKGQPSKKHLNGSGKGLPS